MTKQYKVCMIKSCEKYNIVVETQWSYCPFCYERLTYPVVSKIEERD